MNSNFKKGIYKALAYYAAGFLIALTAYWIVGWEYKHAPGLHHLVGLLFLSGGALWIGYNLILLLAGSRSKVNLGALTVHSTVVGAFILYLVISINSDPVSDEVTDKTDILTVRKDSLTRTALVVNGLGDTLFLEVNDSVLTDKISAQPVENR